MSFELKSSKAKAVFMEIENYLISLNIHIVSMDVDRPWGGFFVIDESQAKEFAELFFPSEDISSLQISGKLSPKILVVAPDSRLSWQYHHRRAEIWRVITGNIGVITSKTDKEGHMAIKKPADQIRLAKGERHRLIGLSDWGVLAEIWQHTDIDHPSDENDIVRVQDDFGR